MAHARSRGCWPYFPLPGFTCPLPLPSRPCSTPHPTHPPLHPPARPQVGAFVPADSLELTPVDAIYVRMGARDRIMLGQSTFLVELSETSAALHR